MPNLVGYGSRREAPGPSRIASNAAIQSSKELAGSFVVVYLTRCVFGLVNITGPSPNLEFAFQMQESGIVKPEPSPQLHIRRNPCWLLSRVIRLRQRTRWRLDPAGSISLIMNHEPDISCRSLEKLALVTLLDEYGDFPGNPKNRDLAPAPAQR